MAKALARLVSKKLIVKPCTMGIFHIFARFCRYSAGDSSGPSKSLITNDCKTNIPNKLVAMNGIIM